MDNKHRKLNKHKTGTSIMKFECIHADTCLPDCWGGHHLPHISIMAYPMTLKQCKGHLKSEVFIGCVMGEYDDTDEEYQAMITAIDNLSLKDDKPDSTIVFDDVIDDNSDNDFSDYPQAYFVFKPIEE